MRLLLVEDDLKIASFISKGFRENGFALDHAIDGEDGLFLALNEPYDAAIVDIMLPRMDGLSLIEELRRKSINTPIIILSAKRSVDDRIKGIQTGGDDYLIKPFSFSELLVRVQALIRRSSGVPEPNLLKAGNLSMNIITREITREDKKIDLQPREFSLLEYLMRNKGRVVTKTMILEHIWDFSFDPQTNVVDVLVCRLRNKVDKDFKQKLIYTIRGIGYVIKEDEQDS
jgi:DNA-binding response OmpR family regulator